MQHLANDASQLGSNVVLVIRLAYPANETFKVEQMAHDGFFAHVFLKAGETLKIWERVQRVKPAMTEIPVTWAVCSDKDRQLESSHNWWIWRTNEKKRLAVKEDELTKAELGLVMSPPQIVERIE
jgi:hypothetical protein